MKRAEKGSPESLILAWLGEHPLYARKAASLEYQEELADYITGLLDDADKRLLGTREGRSLVEVRNAVNSLDGIDWAAFREALPHS